MASITQRKFKRQFDEATAPLRSNVVELRTGIGEFRQVTVTKDVWEWEFLLRHWAREDQPEVVQDFAAEMRSRLEHRSARLAVDDCPPGGMVRPS